MIRTYYAVYGQTIFDIALMTYGTLDELPKLMDDNDFPGVNTYPMVGQAFTYDDTLVFNQTISVQNVNRGVNYVTRSNSTSSQYYQIDELGLPVSINPVVPIPPPLPNDNAMIVVEHGDGHLSIVSGMLTYTATALLGKSNFLIYSTQLGSYIDPEDLFYNPSTGAVMISEEGFTLGVGDQLLIFPDIDNIDLPSTSDLFTTVAGASDSRISIVSGRIVFTDPAIVGLSNVRVAASVLDYTFFRSEDFTFNSGAGTITMYAGFTMNPADQLVIYKQILNPDL